MRLAVVTFKVPFDSDKDITASCFSHDTCCFMCKSVSLLPKAWPHYYGWLNPSVIKARVALFRNYANFPAGSPCAAAIHRAHLNASAWTSDFWKTKISRALIVHQNGPLETSFTFDSSGKMKQNKSGFSESTVERWTGRRGFYIFQLCQQKV